jgi:MYXO-CTERM domain-containing protein
MGASPMLRCKNRMGEALMPQVLKPLLNGMVPRKGRGMPAAIRNGFFLLAVAFAVLIGAGALPARATLLTTATFSVPSAPGNPASAAYEEMVVNTSPVTTWGEKGAVGLQGSQAIFPSGTGYVNTPASTVAFKFNIGSAVDSLNATYGAGHWTIANPKLTFQYTYYANNSVFGGGAGRFETYWVANDAWAFGNGGSAGNAYGTSNYVAGTDAAYATSAASLANWAGKVADLGSTQYNWLGPASNPNYTSWSTAKTGPNQGLLTANLVADPLLANDITAASAASDPNVSLYLMPTSDTLGLTIFTGGGNATPALSFDVVSTPEPATVGLAVAALFPLLRRRRR